jgi:hypothetical protein
MTAAPVANRCDDCGRTPAVVVDLADLAQLCAACTYPYPAEFRQRRFRTRLPLLARTSVHRRHP